VLTTHYFFAVNSQLWSVNKKELACSWPMKGPWKMKKSSAELIMERYKAF
jgi:hypothetical protein